MLRRLRNYIIAWADDYIMESCRDIYESLADFHARFVRITHQLDALDEFKSNVRVVISTTDARYSGILQTLSDIVGADGRLSKLQSLINEAGQRLDNLSGRLDFFSAAVKRYDDFTIESIAALRKEVGEHKLGLTAASVSISDRLYTFGTSQNALNAAVDDKLATLRRDVESLRKQVRNLQAGYDARPTPE